MTQELIQFIKNENKKISLAKEQEDRCFECEETDILKSLTKEELCKALQNFKFYRTGVTHTYSDR